MSDPDVGAASVVSGVGWERKAFEKRERGGRVPLFWTQPADIAVSAQHGPV